MNLWSLLWFLGGFCWLVCMIPCWPVNTNRWISQSLPLDYHLVIRGMVIFTWQQVISWCSSENVLQCFMMLLAWQLKWVSYLTKFFTSHDHLFIMTVTMVTTHRRCSCHSTIINTMLYWSRMMSCFIVATVTLTFNRHSSIWNNLLVIMWSSTFT